MLHMLASSANAFASSANAFLLVLVHASSEATWVQTLSAIYVLYFLAQLLIR